MCEPIYRYGERIYRLELPKRVKKNGHSIIFNCNGENLQTPLYAMDLKKNEKKEGLLLTMKRAGKGAMRKLSPELFDSKIEELNLTLLVPTQMQQVYQTRALNGNRYCVVAKPSDLKSIPETIVIVNPQSSESYNVNITYKGQERYCSRCDKMEVGRCPELKAWYEAKQKRDEMASRNEIRTKMYSDSTLRNADPMGLRSEICCMLGGGLGKVVQAVINDPAQLDHDYFIIFGGTNDMKNQNFPATKEFVSNVDKSLQKLVDVAEQIPNKQFCLVQQTPCLEDEDESDDGLYKTEDEVVRRNYMHAKMNEVASKTSNIQTTNIKYPADETGHPSEEGTLVILNKLNSRCQLPLPLIWNPDFIQTQKVYSRVESIFRYGCNSCDKYGLQLKRDTYSNQLLCDECYEDVMISSDNELLNRVVEQVRLARETNFDTAFPTKRKSSTDLEDVEQNPTKHKGDPN